MKRYSISRMVRRLTVYAGAILLLYAVRASDAEVIGPLGLMITLLVGLTLILIGSAWQRILPIAAAAALSLYTKGVNTGRRVRVRAPYGRKTLRHAAGFEINRGEALEATPAGQTYDLRYYPKCS